MKQPESRADNKKGRFGATHALEKPAPGFSRLADGGVPSVRGGNYTRWAVAAIREPRLRNILLPS